MIARGRTLGAITLLRTADSGRRYGPDDLADVQELARRAALAVDNARLFDEAERAGRARSDFLAVMSHELRTPLNAVLGYAGLLGDGITGPVSEAQRTQLGRIQASARHLLLLVDEVLTLARLEAGTQQVLREPTDLFAVVQETVHLVEPSAAMRGLRLALEGPGERITVSTDPTKLRQVLLNLLSNAAKFTVLGGITVRVSAAPADGDGAAQACVAVTDTGPGIAPEHLDRIFEPFFQVEQRHTRLVGGTGLGLAVSRRLARLLGGDVVVSSAPGAGSTFTICLPVLADGDGAGGAGDAA
jgi:signal transduction histidine kinase